MINCINLFRYFMIRYYLCLSKKKGKLYMNKVLYALLTLIVLASCNSTFNIQGTSNVSTLDGRKLYLKVLQNNDFKNMDSCDVIHGQFSFSGSVDTVRMANIFMDDESVMPLVLEGGNINIKIDNTQQTVSGTPLNDKLFKFIKKYNQIKNQEADLIHRHDQAIMNGKDMDVVNARLSAKADRLSQEEDHLVTNFVTENFDNVLGPGIFFMVTIGNQYPMLDPWVEDIMSKATDKFKNDPYVKDYYEKAQENQQIMNGMKDVSTPPATAGQPVQPAPTPNELAKPSENKK